MSEIDQIVVSVEKLRKLGERCLEQVELPAEQARVAVDVLLWADLRGFSTHGVERLLTYVPRLKKGLINPNPLIKVESKGTCLCLVRGGNGLGQVVAERAIREAISLAKEEGLGLAACRDSNHFGAAAPYTLMVCRERLIGVASTNAFPTMAPTDGLDPLVGNNPLAIGIPTGGAFDFLLDMGMSVSSRGRIRAMAAREEETPPDWALDKKGQPTTDPMKALQGLVLPVGRHKGYGLAVALDILCGVMTGAGFGTGVKSLFQDWDQPQKIGHLFITIDPCRFMPWDEFCLRMAACIGS